MPIMAGFYVGMADGNNVELDPTTKYTLLTVPTVINVGLTAIVNSIGKHVAKKSSYYGVNKQTILSTVQNPTEVEQGLNELENLVNTNIARKSAKAAIKPGIMTTIGYAVGYGCANVL